MKTISRITLNLIHDNETELSFENFEPHSLDEKTLAEINDFRKGIYSISAPYLALSQTDSIERELDLRSWSFIVRNKETGRVCGAVRITSFPYEYTLSFPQLRDLSEVKRYMDINRLVTQPGMRNVGKKLLANAAGYVILNSKVRGYVAACREDKVKMFEKFGMKVYRDKIYSNEREGYYALLIGSKYEMTYYFLKNYITRFINLRKSFGQIVSEHKTYFIIMVFALLLSQFQITL